MDSKYLLALNAHPKIGSQTIKKLLSFFDNDAEKMWKESKKIADISPKLFQLIGEAVEKFDPDIELDKLSRQDVGYITMYDKMYPSQLKEVYDCPAVLYIKGDVKSLSTVSLGVVGSRKYTSYGKQVAHRISKDCASNGLTIVSGLALGIDTVAHQAALDVNGLTIGVLGCGLDQIYPQSNLILANEIIKKGGAIISEYPIGTVPFRSNFPARNRIIAGLSRGVIVIEAAEKSGALITAYAALEYNRDVFAVPGNIFSENSFGVHKLIKEGAKLITSSEDIFEEINVKKRGNKSIVENIVPETENEKIIINLLSTEDKFADAIVVECGLNIIEVNAILTILEMKGMVENVGGGMYRKIN